MRFARSTWTILGIGDVSTLKFTADTVSAAESINSVSSETSTVSLASVVTTASVRRAGDTTSVRRPSTPTAGGLEWWCLASVHLVAPLAAWLSLARKARSCWTWVRNGDSFTTPETPKASCRRAESGAQRSCHPSWTSEAAVTPLEQALMDTLRKSIRRTGTAAT